MMKFKLYIFLLFTLTLENNSNASFDRNFYFSNQEQNLINVIVNACIQTNLNPNELNAVLVQNWGIEDPVRQLAVLDEVRRQFRQRVRPTIDVTFHSPEISPRVEPDVLDNQFPLLNQKLDRAELLSKEEVLQYLRLAQGLRHDHDRYRRLLYWFHNKSGEYSMGQSAFYIDPIALAHKLMQKMNQDGLTYQEVLQFINALKEKHRDYVGYQGETYRHHAGNFNGVPYGENGNIHLDNVANQQINFGDDTKLYQDLKNWVQSQGNRNKKCVVKNNEIGTAELLVPKESALSAATTNEERNECPVCFEDLNDPEVVNVTLPCKHVICRDCFNSLDMPHICPICRYNPLKKIQAAGRGMKVRKEVAKQRRY